MLEETLNLILNMENNRDGDTPMTDTDLNALIERFNHLHVDRLKAAAAWLRPSLSANPENALQFLESFDERQFLEDLAALKAELNRRAL